MDNTNNVFCFYCKCQMEYVSGFGQEFYKCDCGNIAEISEDEEC